jgi:hypothetical protein
MKIKAAAILTALLASSAARAAGPCADPKSREFDGIYRARASASTGGT